MLQDFVLSVSLVLMGILAVVFLWVAVGARDAVTDSGAVILSAYRMRGWLFAIALIVLIGANARTLTMLPYAATHEQAGPPAGAAIVPVEAVGQQWRWSIRPDAFVVGQTAEFHVTADDVNHGFAIYDPDMHIVSQTQAMPGYTNVLRYRFVKPGTYRVLCLEYCGIGHHEMQAQINVVAH